MVEAGPSTDPVEVVTAAGRARRAGRRALAGLTSRDRLVLAAKAAGAGVAAWLLARLLPGFLDDYAYYAPFGAVVAMMPSVADSLRTGVHALAGLLLGGALAWAAFGIGLPVLATVPVVIVVAILVAGMLPPGPGRDYLPVAAIFVLMAGGGDPETFGTAYVLLTGVGLVVGAVVNLAILPPLRTVPVEARLEALQTVARSLLDDLADSIEDAELPRVSIEDRASRLQRAADEAQRALWDAQRTRRANVRARGGRYAVTASERRLGSLQVGVRELTALASVVSEERVTPQVPDAMPTEVRDPVAAALRAIGQAHTEADADLAALAEASRRAREALLAWEAPSREAGAAAGAIAHHLAALEQRATGAASDAA